MVKVFIKDVMINLGWNKCLPDIRNLEILFNINCIPQRSSIDIGYLKQFLVDETRRQL